MEQKRSTCITVIGNSRIFSEKVLNFISWTWIIWYFMNFIIQEIQLWIKSVFLKKILFKGQKCSFRKQFRNVQAMIICPAEMVSLCFEFEFVWFRELFHYFASFCFVVLDTWKCSRFFYLNFFSHSKFNASRLIRQWWEKRVSGTGIVVACCCCCCCYSYYCCCFWWCWCFC